MILHDNHKGITDFKKAQRERILGVFGQPLQADNKFARAITKAEFEQEFPADKFEIYSLAKVHAFREQILKSEGVDDKDAFFKAQTEDLKALVIHNGDNKTPVFVRAKEKGEK